MEPRIENTSKSIEVINQWYKSAVATAIIGGVFSVVIVALIVANYFQSWVVNAKREKQLETLKVEIRSQPDTPDYSVRGQARDYSVRGQARDYSVRGQDCDYDPCLRRAWAGIRGQDCGAK